MILFIWAYNLLVAVFFPFAYDIITDTAEFKSTAFLLFSIDPSGLDSFFSSFLLSFRLIEYLFLSPLLLAFLCFISAFGLQYMTLTYQSLPSNNMMPFHL